MNKEPKNYAKNPQKKQEIIIFQNKQKLSHTHQN